MNEIRLVVDGKLYVGWKRVEVQRSIEQIAGGFVLELTHAWPGVAIPQGLREGLACQVFIDNDLVISGYIDLYEPEMTDAASFIRVEGRDRTGDLVDCSAIHKTGQWRNAPLELIVRDIAAPFGIGVLVSAGVNQGDLFKSFALEDGEKAFDAIDRACRMRAVLCTSTPEGNVLLTQASDDHTGVTLEEGVNIQRINAAHTWKERHSQIIIKGQSPADDLFSGPSAAQQKAEATDAEINRYRPLIVIAEQGTTLAALKNRAAWEVKVRMGRGKRGRCVVVGWRRGKEGQEGDLWRPNTLVRMKSGRMNMDMDVLIVGCAYTQTEAGRTTELTYARPEAFSLVEGVGRSTLRGRLNDKAKRDKQKDGFVPSWQLQPPTPKANP